MMRTAGGQAPAPTRDIQGIFTLFTMTSMALYAMYDLHWKRTDGTHRDGHREYPLWTLGSFGWTIVGGTIGFLWESFGKNTTFISEIVDNLRKANVGLVMLSTMITCCMVGRVPWNDKFTTAAAFHGAALWLSGYLNLQNRLKRQTLYILASKALEIYVVYRVSAEGAYAWLIAATVANALSFVAPGLVPQQYGQAVFHAINTFSTCWTWWSIRHLPSDALVDDPDVTPLLVLSALIGAVSGVVTVAYTDRLTYNKFRLVVNGIMWNTIYLLILKGGWMEPVPAEPAQRHEKYIRLLPYRTNVPRAAPLGVPNPDAIPQHQKLKNYHAVRILFRVVMKWVDEYWPQARADEPLKYKPRIRADVGSDYFVPPLLGKHMTKMEMGVPPSLEEAMKYGQDIAWMTLYGHISTMLTKMPSAEAYPEGAKRVYAQAAKGGATHVVDLEWMARYPPKDDFFPYGGRAFYGKDSGTLVLKYLTLPQDNGQLIAVNINSDRFQKARLLFLASSNVGVVAGLHLAGIHMLYDLVSVALFNAFDRDAEEVHPFRAVMQLHFFNHTMVDVATTPHLMEKGAVFTQIWALTHRGICELVEDYFHEKLVFGAEDDLDTRRDVLGEETSQHKQLDWMGRYKDIYTKYAETVINRIFVSDKAVAADGRIQAFYKELHASLSVTASDGLPPRRYGTLSSKQHLINFLADALFHITVMHEMHGTKTPAYSLNPKLMQVAVATDLSAPAREDYNSLVLVSAATARVKFPKLIQQKGSSVFSTLPDHNNTQLNLRRELIMAFDSMVGALNDLDGDWGALLENNEDLKRKYILPRELETGAGY